MNKENRFMKLFNWFFGPESREAIRYYREIGVMVPFGVIVFYTLCWLLRVYTL